MEMTQRDLIMAFFPCERFCCLWASFHLRCGATQNKGLSDRDKVAYARDCFKKTAANYDLFCKLFLIAYERKLRLIIENPYSGEHLLKRAFPIKPALIDDDRRFDGDIFKKPTMFYFVNCRPAFNYLEPLTLDLAKAMGIQDTPAKHRSDITPLYAERFVKKYIIEDDTR